MIAAMLAAALIPLAPPRELYDYLAKPDTSFHFEVTDPKKGLIEMVSQTWQGHPWKHSIIWRQPSKLQTKGTAILFITGDGPFAGDYTDLMLVTAATGMPTAMLFDVPYQPIFGKKEDDLIAYTLEEYLRTKDPNWPLLFPMAKSALRAMDVIQAVTRHTANPIHRFVVTGASKRGWTTWFVGASKDPRVKGIAPMVIDNLNIPKQMRHQIDSWGFFSDELDSYTKLGLLQNTLPTPEGLALARLVDPYSYRANIKVPTLIVKGANDPYWTADALSQYWDDLKEPKWAVTVPNAGHDLGNKIEAVESIGAFARSIAGDFRMPKQSWAVSDSANSITVTLSSQGPTLVRLRLWYAESDTLDFRKSVYRSVDGDLSKNHPSGPVSGSVSLSPLENQNYAVFGEARYRVGTREFSLCCPTKVFKLRR